MPAATLATSATNGGNVAMRATTSTGRPPAFPYRAATQEFLAEARTKFIRKRVDFRERLGEPVRDLHVLDRIETIFHEHVARELVREGSKSRDAEQFAAQIAYENDRWPPIVKAAGIKLE